jgi:hypothetical protein
MSDDRASARVRCYLGRPEHQLVTLALGFFILSDLVWIGFLLRLQNRRIQLSANPAGSAEPLPEAFVPMLHAWYSGGSMASVLPLMSLPPAGGQPQLMVTGTTAL